jgi:hypothetical protein
MSRKCGRELQVEARMTFEPGFRLQVFVGTVVIDNQMEFQFDRHLAENS